MCPIQAGRAFHIDSSNVPVLPRSKRKLQERRPNMSQFDKDNYGRVQQRRVSPTDRCRYSIEPDTDHNGELTSQR
jgi:hypothetical protein